ncbi:MAG: plasmid partitioning protein RepB, partial [Pseudomonadota bacterium]
REDTMRALSISKNVLSQLERIARLIPHNVGWDIGPAHKAGRPKWMALAAAFEEGLLSEPAVNLILARVPEDATSEERLQAVLDSLQTRGTPDTRAATRSMAGGTTVKSTKSSLTVSIRRAGDSAAFADWLDRNIDRVIEDSYRSFTQETEGDGS